MVIFHIDVNSAYLSWSSANLLEKGYPLDIRAVPSVIAGDPENRQGIILAKSIPAKNYGIKTGESLFEARNKCPELLIFPPDYDLYMMCSDAMFAILGEYSSLIQRYSVDECFLDYTNSQNRFGSPLQAAYEIKERMKKELGFTVNIGIGANKVLAKMASEMEKPDKVHTLFPDEIQEKLWKLPVGELFMVGRATDRKLRKININTIGDLAKSELLHMRSLLKSHGELVWNYANGVDASPVVENREILQNGVGSSTTTSYDLMNKEESHMIMLALCERTAMRLRKLERKASLVSISVKTNTFVRYSHQVQLQDFIDSATDIYNYAVKLFAECWRGEAVRHLGVSVSNFGENQEQQLSLFQEPIERIGRNSLLEHTIDEIRGKFGEKAIIRGTFANGSVEPLQGGVNGGNYLMMGGYEL